MTEKEAFLVSIINQRTSPCLVYVEPAGEGTQLAPGAGTLIRIDKAEGAMTIEVHEYGGIDIRASAEIVMSSRDVDSRGRFLAGLALKALLVLIACLAVAWIYVMVLHGWFGVAI